MGFNPSYTHLEVMVKELDPSLRQFHHLQKLDEAFLVGDKKKIFRHYYGVTRTVTKVNGELKITVDEGMVNYLKGKL